MGGKDTPKYDVKKLKTPTLKRLAKEHIAIHELCSRSDKLSYKIIKSRSGVPEVYRITFKVKSIVGIDSDKNPIYGYKHEAELALPPNYPVEPAKCYMVTDTWHPNIKSDGVHKGHICTNSNELGKLMDLYLLVHRIGQILQYQNYHAQNVYPYPDDEKVAKWVREYAEPKNIVNKKKNIFIDDSSLLFDDTKDNNTPKIDNPPPINSVTVSSSEEIPKTTPPPVVEEEDAPIKIKKISIKSIRNKPPSDGKIKIKRKK